MTTSASAAVGRAGRRPLERRRLHFDLSHLDTANEYTLHACLEPHPVHAHTAESRQRAREAAPVLRAVPDERLTHYAELDLPSDAIALLSVTRPDERGGHRLATMAIHVPQDAYRTEQLRMRDAASTSGGLAVHAKLRLLGVDPQKLRAVTGSDDPAPYPTHIDDYNDAVTAAVALLFHHRDVMNLQVGGYGAAYIIQQYLEANPSISDVALQIVQLGDDWMTQTPVLDENGQQMHDDQGNRLWTQTVDPDVKAAAKGPLAWAVRAIKNDPNLEGVQWTVQQGVTAADYGASVAPQTHAPHAAAARAARLAEVARVAAASGGFNWTVQNLSPSNGFTVDPAVNFQPAPTTAAWSGTGFWSQPSAEAGQSWRYAQQLLGGEVYLTVTTPDHAQGLVRSKLVPGAPSTADGTTPFTVDLSGIGPACTATLTLNAMETSLAYKLSLQGAALDHETVGAGFCDAAGNELADVPLSDASGYGTLNVKVTNHWLRHLSAYVQFLDDGGNAITPQDWDEVLPDFLRALFQPDDTKKYVELISPVDTICGIPLPAEATELAIPIPENAVTVRLLCGGLGAGQFDHAVCGIGITGTVVGELALPIIVLVAGAAITDTKPVRALLADKQLLFGVCTVAGFLVAGGVATDIAVTHNARPALVKLADSLGPLLLKTGLKWFIAKMVAEGTAERAIPWVDTAFEVFDTLVTMAEVAQTTIEVLESPFVYEADVTRSIDVQVTLTPDQRFHEFPPESIGGEYMVNVVYDNNATYASVVNQLPSTTQSDPITVTFRNCPAGGNLTVRAFFYAPNGWQAGQGETGWLPALATTDATLVIPALEVTTNEVPLSASSVYQHKQKIVYNGGHSWTSTNAPPVATVATPSPYIGEGKQLTNWTGITLAQSPAQVAYSYEATGLDSNGATLYTVENLSILEHPDSEYAVPQPPGFGDKTAAVYDLVSPDGGTGLNFWIDPSPGAYDPVDNPAGGYHLRRVALGSQSPPPSFAAGTGQSWGRFTLAMDRYAIHPKGYVVGISYDIAKLEILQIPSAPAADADAPIATLAGGQGFRQGLMAGPVALGVALDGRILILEAINQRIQAFTVDGAPVPCFGTKTAPSSWTPLYDTTGAHYLDVSVEAKGYIYVLGYDGDPANPASYFVDIYEPDGHWLVRTPGVTAAKIVVDLMRSLYTLNYEVILGAGGRPEPSISMWLPPPPA